jgi:hypothetical protein
MLLHPLVPKGDLHLLLQTLLVLPLLHFLLRFLLFPSPIESHQRLANSLRPSLYTCRNDRYLLTAFQPLRNPVLEEEVGVGGRKVGFDKEEGGNGKTPAEEVVDGRETGGE